MRELVFATGDEVKLRLAEAALSGLPVRLVRRDLALPEIQSLDPAVVAADKAVRAHAMLRRPVVAEDSSLEIEELDGFPGALVKPIVARVGAEGICRFADLTRGRAARMTRSIAYADAGGVETFTSRDDGWRIADRPCRTCGAGSTLDELARVLVPAGFDRPLALLDRADLAGLHAAWIGDSCYAELARRLAGEMVTARGQVSSTERAPS